MIYCAFTLAAFASAIVTLGLFIAADHTRGLDFRTMSTGAMLSITEAGSGWLAVRSLDQFDAPLLGTSISTTAPTVVIAAMLTATGFFVARDILIHSFER